MEDVRDIWKKHVKEAKTDEKRKSAEEMLEYFSTPAFQSAYRLPSGYSTISKDGYLSHNSPDPKEGYIGIIKNQTTKKDLMNGIIRPERHVADVYFDSDEKGASIDGRWVIDFYDADHIIPLTDSLQKVAQEYGVDLKTSLNKEKKLVEKKFEWNPKDLELSVKLIESIGKKKK